MHEIITSHATHPVFLDEWTPLEIWKERIVLAVMAAISVCVLLAVGAAAHCFWQFI